MRILGYERTRVFYLPPLGHQSLAQRIKGRVTYWGQVVVAFCSPRGWEKKGVSPIPPAKEGG